MFVWTTFYIQDITTSNPEVVYMRANWNMQIFVIFFIIGATCIFPVLGDTQAQTVTDMSGTDITVPTDIQRIVIACQGGVAQEIVIMGDPNTVVAISSMNLFPMFLKMFPNLKDLPNAGSFDDLNMETILNCRQAG